MPFSRRGCIWVGEGLGGPWGGLGGPWGCCSPHGCDGGDMGASVLGEVGAMPPRCAGGEELGFFGAVPSLLSGFWEGCLLDEALANEFIAF